jgi:hypothetical protein
MLLLGDRDEMLKLSKFHAARPPSELADKSYLHIQLER